MENLDICKNCGGVCCKKSGCDYLPKDFNDLSLKGILSILDGGNVSVVSCLKFKRLPNSKLTVDPFLYLRARNKNRDIIDILSFKTTCSMWTSEGCKYSYEDRPSMGKNLVPVEGLRCYPLNDVSIIYDEWERYQKVLQKVVKIKSGIDVYEKLRQDSEKLFFDCFTSNYDDVDIRELLDVKRMIGPLSEVYYDEFVRAVKKVKTYIKI